MLDNALKLTPAGGRVAVTVEVTAEMTAEMTVAESPKQVHITVTDSGSGIASADLPHLFDRLYQARSSAAPASSAEGKGLGLTIVKRIVELHGGTLQVHSEPGHGTRVQMTLPTA